MKKFFPILGTCPLFTGIKEAELGMLLSCLSAVRKTYGKNGLIFMAGEKPPAIGVALSGRMHVVREDFWGKRDIFAHVEPGDLFVEAFACAGIEALPVSVIAVEKSEALMIDYRRVMTTCSSACVFHLALLKNMLRILAEKNISLTRKMEHLTRRTTRDKLLSYLSERAGLAGRPSFDIPFNRQQLADYLSVDRSAMSNELSKMREEGLLAFARNHFELCGNTTRSEERL